MYTIIYYQFVSEILDENHKLVVIFYKKPIKMTFFDNKQ